MQVFLFSDFYSVSVFYRLFQWLFFSLSIRKADEIMAARDGSSVQIIC
jgi:hypothetical protein